MTDLQEALSVVITGDEIWVAAGQYKPTTTTDRTISFVLRDGVNLYGGFAGTETQLAQRDIAMNTTTLNGDIGALGEINDNTYSVVRGNNILTDIELDGFRIINGKSNSTGGGLKITYVMGGSLSIKNCFISGNRAYNYGGGLYMAHANIIIEGCQFVNNDSDNGGAIHNGNNNGGYSNLTIRDSRFSGNTAYSGACLDNSLQYDALVIDRCIFTNNRSPNSILDIDDFVSFRMVNSSVIGNTVDGFSSNIIHVNTFGGSGNGDAQLINCTIAHNFNIYVNTVQDVIVKLDDNEHIISNCIIYGNTAHNGRQLNNGLVVSHSLIQGGYATGTNIIDMDPIFTMPNTTATTNFDATLFDYTLQASSHAINTGNNALIDPIYDLDLALNVRIQGPAIDLGCYETDILLALNETSVRAELPYYFDADNAQVVFLDPTTQMTESYWIYDAMGKLQRSGIVAGTRLPICLKAGAYILRMNGTRSLRFVTL